MKPLFLILILILSALQTVAQNADGEEEDFVEPKQALIDSLKSLITPTTPDSLLAKYYGEIANNSYNADTKIKYATLSMNLCNETDYYLLIINNVALGYAFRINGEYKKALPYIQKAIYYAQKINDPTNLAQAYQCASYLYDDLNNTDSAAYYMNNALELGIRNGDSTFVAVCYQDLGIMYGSRDMFAESKNYLDKAALLDSSTGNWDQYATDLLFLAQLTDAKKPDSVQEYFEARNHLDKAVSILDTIDTYDKYLAYGTFASIYIAIAQKQGNRAYADSCLWYYKKAEPFFQLSSGKQNYQIFRMIYVNYLVFCKKYDEAINVMKELEATFDEESSVDQYNEFHITFRDIYLAIGDYKNAYYHSEKHHEYARAYINDSTMTVLSDAKAQQAVMIEKLNREKAETESRRMKTVAISLIVGLVLVSLLVFYIARILRIKHRSNKQLAEKNLLLVEKNSEIETQKKIITEQWQEVEKVNDKLIKSITYAQRIQTAAISSEADVKAMFPESFVYYRPRDIVSGDFYHCAVCGKYRVMVTADCTGHGIPGAFLSMLGISALKEFCVSEYDAANPGTILDRMRELILTTLDRGGNTVSDGMDMTICSYDILSMELRYATANQKFLLIRHGEAIKLSGNNMPVGRSISKNEHFDTFVQPLEHDDTIYTFSDGIQDQLGIDPSGNIRKFSSLQLMETLLSISPKPLAEQCNLLDRTITQWRNSRPQVDDMTMIGIRV